MKELTIEEKAIRYDEALKVLHKYDGANIMFSQSLKEEMFPELKEEYEDEKIRKALIKYYSFNKDGGSHALDNITPKQILAWLEKQGEQKPSEKPYTFKAIPHLLDMIEPTSKSKSYCQKLINILISEGYNNDAKIVGECLKQMNGEKVPMATMDEQNSVWSGEDDEHLERILKELDNQRQRPINSPYLDKIESDYNWLKSLKDRVQPKQEWSEEDDRMRKAIIDNIKAICEEGYFVGDIGSDKLINWLKSLKPQNRWKPSDTNTTSGTSNWPNYLKG